MKILWADKDGGPESKVWYWGIESKRFGSIVLLLFRKGTRPVYHSHAFNSISWVLTGGLREKNLHSVGFEQHFPSLAPIQTHRETTHQVEGLFGKNWVISLRGPWVDYWQEFGPDGAVTLTHGRKVV